MNLDELRTVQSKERQKDSLQHLRPSFYREVGDYIADLKEERDRVAEAADDPFSEPEVGRLTDEIETAKDVVEAIYERRMGKLVKQASLAAAGMPADDEGLTAEEQDLFEDLVDRIRSNKNHVLDVLEDGSNADSAASESETADAARDAAPGDVATGDAGADETAADTPPAPPETAPSEGETARGATDRGTTDANPRADSSAPADPDASANSDASPADDADGVSAADVMGGTGPADSSPPPEAPGPSGGSDSESGPPVPDGPDDGSRDSNGPGEGGTGGPDDGDGAGEPEGDRRSDAGDGEGTDPSADGGPGGDVDRVTVRITRDVGSILGIDDREYTLASDDVVTLPEQNAEPLVERDAAEPLE